MNVNTVMNMEQLIANSVLYAVRYPNTEVPVDEWKIAIVEGL